VVGFVALLVVLPLLGLLLRRWSLVLLPLMAWPTYSIGVNQRWWGCCGTGDSWELGAFALTIVGVATTALAIWIGRTFAG
jgi:hypothetical protein